jgi:hypothetical protein
MRIQRLDQLLDPRSRRQRRHRHDRRLARPHGAQSRGEVAPRPQRGVAHVGLRHDQHVRHFHDPGLQELQRVAGTRLHDHRDGVAQLGDVGLGLADANRLDNHHVESSDKCLGRIPGCLGETAEPGAGSCGADQDPVVTRVVLDPHAVTEQRPA